MASVALVTLGCKVSQYETQAIAEALEARGLTVLADGPADAYVINTCTVTAEGDAKARRAVRRVLRQNPRAVVAVLGCYAQTSPEELMSIEGVRIVLGTANKLSVVDHLCAHLSGEREVPECLVTSLDGAPFEPMCITRAPRTRAYLKIEDGCECRCTYCAIPGARGAVRSKAVDDVIAEAEALAGRGTAEIVLTGIETASYGADRGDGRLIDLLETLDRRGRVPRIRLGSLSPEVMTEEFARRIGALRTVVPHLHLSMQSGSDKILRAMKRRYSRAMAEAAIERARAYIPRLELTTDLMVGFPGEEEEDFLDTVSLLHTGNFLAAHVFAYSRRRGTPAATYDGQVKEDIKRERSRRLIAEAAAVRDRILDRIVRGGETQSVIPEVRAEGVYTAHADTFVAVSVVDRDPSLDRRGQICRVRPVAHKEGVLLAEFIDE